MLLKSMCLRSALLSLVWKIWKGQGLWIILLVWFISETGSGQSLHYVSFLVANLIYGGVDLWKKEMVEGGWVELHITCSSALNFLIFSPFSAEFSFSAEFQVKCMLKNSSHISNCESVLFLMQYIPEDNKPKLTLANGDIGVGNAVGPISPVSVDEPVTRTPSTPQLMSPTFTV